MISCEKMLKAVSRYGIDSVILSQYLIEYACGVDHNWFANDGEIERNILEANDFFDLVLIYWGRNYNGDIHSHEKGGCLMYVYEGTLTEYRYSVKDGALIGISTLSAGNISPIHNSFALHKVDNESSCGAVSLHLYIK